MTKHYLRFCLIIKFSKYVLIKNSTQLHFINVGIFVKDAFIIFSIFVFSFTENNFAPYLGFKRKVLTETLIFIFKN